MAVHHLTLTLNGSIQPLSATVNPSINVCELHLQSEANNANIYVGGPTVSSTDYGYALISTATIPGELNMRQASHRINLATTYVIGTNAQKLHILYIQ